MRIIWICGLLSIASSLVAAALFPGAAVEILLGMILPATVGGVTVLWVKRVCGQNYSKLTAFMTRAFLAKMVFYGVAVIMTVGVYSFQPIPFAVSLTGYFLACHMAEALYFRKLFKLA